MKVKFYTSYIIGSRKMLMVYDVGLYYEQGITHPCKILYWLTGDYYFDISWHFWSIFPISFLYSKNVVKM